MDVNIKEVDNISPVEIASIDKIAPIEISSIDKVEKIAPVAVHIKELNQVEPLLVESLRIDRLRPRGGNGLHVAARHPENPPILQIPKPHRDAPETDDQVTGHHLAVLPPLAVKRVGDTTRDLSGRRAAYAGRCSHRAALPPVPVATASWPFRRVRHAVRRWHS